MAKKKNNPYEIYEAISVIQNDIKWIKKDLSYIKKRIDKLSNRFWALVLALLGILCTIIAALAGH